MSLSIVSATLSNQFRCVKAAEMVQIVMVQAAVVERAALLVWAVWAQDAAL